MSTLTECIYTCEEAYYNTREQSSYLKVGTREVVTLSSNVGKKAVVFLDGRPKVHSTGDGLQYQVAVLFVRKPTEQVFVETPRS